VWAPGQAAVSVRLDDPDRTLRLSAAAGGTFEAVVEDVAPGRRYRYVLDDGAALPDPASAWQPDGVHGPSAVVGRDHPWTDAGWRGVPLEDAVLYELHVGTFTPAGTFASAVERLPDLVELGVTVVELMPVAEFPGGRNWGYDGVFPFAAQSTYGGPGGLRDLVDACHAAGLGVCLDVVYNHLGPEGNVLPRFGPYFTDRYRTPWGDAVNVDAAGADGVRRYLVQNALRWFEDFHLDALRLDAVHAIADTSARPFLAELADATAGLAERLGRPLHLIAESDLNDPRMVRARAAGGLGMDAQWTDDFHHALHALLTGEREGYYADFGGAGAMARALAHAFVYDGGHSRYRDRRHGDSAAGLPGRRFVVYAQNHDQVGNRMLGERLAQSAGLEAAKLAAGTVLLAPYVPLLFMGEEHAAGSPFHYFTSHSDPELAEAVRAGRAAEFAGFRWQGEPPDPQDPATFERSRIDWAERDRDPHRQVLALHRELLRLRRELGPLRRLDRERVEVARADAPPVVWLRRWDDQEQVLACLHYGEADAELDIPFAGAWGVALDSADARFGGPGGGALGARLAVRARSFVLMTEVETA
jgi:maltooligosyltrehalose trehalohydrolase